ncbi:MAG: MerC domain-containing protein [Ignavibacteria bacterium]
MINNIKHNLALKLDLIGFSASTICAIHCALMPFIILFLPLLGLEIIANPIIEYSVIFSSMLIGFYTFKHGYFKHHRKAYPFAIFVIGLVLIVAGHFFFHDHSIDNKSILESTTEDALLFLIAPLGALLIALSHFINRSLSKKNTVSSCIKQNLNQL